MRVPSGRCTDSTFTTSAPRKPRICAAYGPAQYDVKSNTRSPASGRAASSASVSCATRTCRGSARSDSVSPPSGATGPNGRVGARPRRYGTRGCTMAPSGCSTNTSRSTKGANPGRVSPLPNGATGIRRSLARCSTSSVVRAVVNAAISARSIRSCSPRRSTRPSSGWSAHSGCPTISANARNCAEPLVAKPTHPSAVGSTDGTSTKRPIGSGSGPRPSSCAATAWNWLNAIVIASKVETSTDAPRPLRRAPWSAASAATPPTVPATHSPMRPPVATGGSCFRPRLAIEPHQACNVNSVAARSAHGPLPPNHEIDTTTTRGDRLRNVATSYPSHSSSWCG